MGYIFFNPKKENIENNESRWWIGYHLLIGIILYSWIKASGLYELILGFFYVGSSHPAASFYGFMAGLITFTINLAGYKFSKKVIASINKSKLSVSSKKRFIIFFPIILFVSLGLISYIPYTLIQKKEKSGKYSSILKEEEDVITAISVEHSKGLKESDFNLSTLKILEAFYTKRVKQKVDDFLLKQGYTSSDLNLRISSNSYYINFEGKKIAVIKIKIHDFTNSVFIIGMSGNDLIIKVSCTWENYKDEVSIFTGKCGKEIAKAFGISLPLQDIN